MDDTFYKNHLIRSNRITGRVNWIGLNSGEKKAHRGSNKSLKYSVRLLLSLSLGLVSTYPSLHERGEQTYNDEDDPLQEIYYIESGVLAFRFQKLKICKSTLNSQCNLYEYEILVVVRSQVSRKGGGASRGSNTIICE